MVNLGDGGSSDVWAPEVVTVADGLRSALPDGGGGGRRASIPTARRPWPRRPTSPWSWSGYTRLDEGEYIGEFATAHLAHLFPGEDDPALVERFTARIAAERSIEPPEHVAPSGPAAGSRPGVTGDRCGSTITTWS